jgi:hypothetical protein
VLGARRSWGTRCQAADVCARLSPPRSGRSPRCAMLHMNGDVICVSTNPMASYATVELIILLRSGASLRLWHSALSLLAPFTLSPSPTLALPSFLFSALVLKPHPWMFLSCQSRLSRLPCFSHNFHTCAGAPHGTMTPSARTPGTTPYIVLPQIDAFHSPRFRHPRTKETV